ncbi:MAG: ribosome-associated translation inhibitor RaiA [Spirochaetia bacterium]|nr:ribosome-associated translation inhibitor RaiA [Spirochaetia bacterium]
MSVSFYFKNLEPTEGIKEHTSEKLEKVRERFHHVEGIDVRFSLERQNQICEITVRADSTVFHVEKSEKDLYAAIDLALDTLSTQVDKYHKKIDSRTLNSDEEAAQILPSFQTAAHSEETVINIYDAPVKPMDDFEAALQMQLHKYRFLMYHEADKKKYSLCFLRPDGNYSIIKPTETLGQYEENIFKFKNNKLEKLSVSLYPLSLFTIPEAVEQIRESNHEYLAFVNEESRRMNVLFYAKSGQLGLKRPVI